MARKYTPEFKEDAVRYVEEHPEMENHQKAEYLGVPYHTLYGWVKEHRRKIRAGESEPIKGNLTPEEKEIARLRRENQELQDALKILKKPSAFWATDRIKVCCNTRSSRIGTPDLCQQNA